MYLEKYKQFKEKNLCFGKLFQYNPFHCKYFVCMIYLHILSGYFLVWKRKLEIYRFQLNRQGVQTAFY